MTLEGIKKSISIQWENYEKFYDELMASPIELLDTVNHYQKNHSGKQIRPLLVLLSAYAVGNESTHLPHLATAVELLHNASLMHDDVVDDDSTRRGAPSVQKRWNIHVALLTGDWFLAKMMLMMHHIDDKHASEMLVRAAVAMAEGEMLQQQLQLSPTQHADPETYMRIVRLKTAELMCCCCKIATYNHPQAAFFADFGLHFGMAFQLHDDIVDYPDESYSYRPEIETIKKTLSSQINEALSSLSQINPSQYTENLRQLTLTLDIS